MDAFCTDRLDHDDPCRVGAARSADRIDARLEVHVQVRLCLRRIAAAGLIRLVEALQHQTAVETFEGRGDLRPHRRDFRRHGLGGGGRRGEAHPAAVSIRFVVGVDEDIHAGVDGPLRRLHD
jgi:hypothetical protein